jgi:hypothetical protein
LVADPSGDRHFPLDSSVRPHCVDPGPWPIRRSDDGLGCERSRHIPSSFSAMRRRAASGALRRSAARNPCTASPRGVRSSAFASGKREPSEIGLYAVNRRRVRPPISVGR